MAFLYIGLLLLTRLLLYRHPLEEGDQLSVNRQTSLEVRGDHVLSGFVLGVIDGGTAELAAPPGKFGVTHDNLIAGKTVGSEISSIEDVIYCGSGKSGLYESRPLLSVKVILLRC